MMNFIKIPQLLIPILFVVLSLSNAFAFAAEEEEIVAFQSELPSDASTYTIKQQGEHWNSPGWRIEGYTKDLPAANVEIVSVENHANTANAVIVNWRYLCESCVAGGNDRMACHAGSTGVNCNPKSVRCFTSDNCDDFWNMLSNHKSQSTVATKLVDFLKTTMTDLTDADNAYENQVSGDKVGPQVIYKYVLKTTTTTTGSDDDDIEPIDIALYIGAGFLGLKEMVKITKICCIGAGYVGGPTMAMIALKCPHIEVTVVDLNQQRIDAWNSDNLPIYEPGLDEVVKACRGKNLFFSTDCEAAIRAAQCIFVSVNTPTKKTGLGKGKAADLTYWESAARNIAAWSTSDKIIVEKSTVPVRTAEAIEKVLLRNCPQEGVHFDILSNPEFLAEGTAIDDLTMPDRVLIGGKIENDRGTAACAALCEVYANWVPKERILTANLWSAELSKLTANAMLAQRISSINAISALCECTGADVSQVSFAIGKDSRIGPKFLNASVGFGGSCFQKDILNLAYICECHGLQEVADYWYSVVGMNDYQKTRFVRRVVSAMFNTIRNKKIAMLGFAFKKDTGDTRETPAIDVAHGMIEDGAKIALFDPQVPEEQVRMDMGEEAMKSITCYSKPTEALKDAHAVTIMTEWDEFKTYDWRAIYEVMHKPAFVFDGRNILDHAHLSEIGFIVYALGKPIDPFLKSAEGA
ncbi:unnamed protein product [Bathycoccus prasinos]